MPTKLGKESTSTKEKDPVCGMDVETKAALKESAGWKSYYFCSEECRETYKKNPGSFSRS